MSGGEMPDNLQVGSSAANTISQAESSLSSSTSQLSPQESSSQITETSTQTKSSSKKPLFIVLAIAAILIATTVVLHMQNVGYSVNQETLENVEATILINKESPTVQVKNVMYKNSFITPRRIELPELSVCMLDSESDKKTLSLETNYTLERFSVFSESSTLDKNVGGKIWLAPFSELNVYYFVKGDWYDYIYQYLDYDELKLVTLNVNQSKSDCESTAEQTQSEVILINKTDCIDCVKSIGGLDLAVVDFIVNDDKIWRDGFISYVPIIKNVGDQPSGPFEVIYYLNGKRSSSFELNNLESGEVVNNFIAGSGFGGNFAAKDIKPEMELKIELKSEEEGLQYLENNQYTWKFAYSSEPLPKHSCTYKDNNQGPEDFYSLTSINYSGKPYSDFCLDEDYLIEYLCDDHPVYKGDDNIDVFLYKCPDGCVNGACKRE